MFYDILIIDVCLWESSVIIDFSFVVLVFYWLWRGARFISIFGSEDDYVFIGMIRCVVML